jgi:hypothetical protein
MTDNPDIWFPVWPPNTRPTFTYGRPTFAVHKGKSGHEWLVPAVTVLPNRADHIYVTAYPDPSKKGEGFGGAVLDLPLLTGRSYLLRGGWHSRAEALLDDTGIDVRNLRKTFGAIGFHRTADLEIFGILYADPHPKLGYDDRIVRMAQQLANEYQEPLFYSYLSAGGGAAGLIKPEGR